MKKNRLQLASILVLIAVFMTACGITGEQIGKTYSTKWFEFTIHSIEEIPDFDGYIADNGYRLIDVLVSETGTFEEPSPMGTYDFFIYDETFENEFYPIDPLNSEMMPTSFWLSQDETVLYHMIYEIPLDVTNITLKYIEMDDFDNTGETFSIEIK